MLTAWIVAGTVADSLTIVGTVIAVIVGLAGLAFFVWAATRVKTRDDTIHVQAGYITALREERDDLTKRVTALEARDDLRTKDFAREIAGGISEVMLEAFDSVFSRIEQLERRHHG